jgi:hypothetical protein
MLAVLYMFLNKDHLHFLLKHVPKKISPKKPPITAEAPNSPAFFGEKLKGVIIILMSVPIVMIFVK